jgi:hypothetical protein
LGWPPIAAVAIFAASGLFGQAPNTDTLALNVPATANPYLAGMPSGARAREGDSAPQQAPVQVPRSLSHAVAVTFTAVGAIQHTPLCPPDCSGPNCAAFARHRGGPEHGIADVIAPIDAVMGVFLSDEQPDRGKPPRSLDYRRIRRNSASFSPQLKQVFFIGNGRTNRGAPRRYIVPAKATRLYLAVMDSYEWNNNSGSFTVTVAIERDQVDANMFAVDSSITFNDKWACLPNRARCTPDRPVAEEKAPGEFHVILPASSEWSISVPDAGGTAKIQAAQGTICFTAGACSGPEGQANTAGPGYLAPEKPAGALITKLIQGRIYFSVNHLAGAPFRDHEGYFEFDVRTR